MRHSGLQLHALFERRTVLWRSLWAAVGVLALGLWVTPAWAFFVAIEVIGKVARGQTPELVVTGLQAAQDVVVRIQREDGKKFTFPLGQLDTDGKRRIALDGSLGRHRYQGTVTAQVDGEQVSSELSFETVVAPPIQLTVDRDKLDLDSRTLVLVANVPLAQVQLSVIDIDGHQVFEKEFDVAQFGPNQPITLRWTGGKAADVMRLELHAQDADGFFKAVALTPWSVSVPHEEVLFATNSAVITAAEERKLEASLEHIQATLERFEQIKGVELFIAGHSDTVGKPAHNAQLSRLRAQAIGKWFVEHKLAIPVHFEGFGESSLRVKTKDEVDEPQNRRVDYILAVEPPPLRSATHGWKRLQ